jgi:glucokinase
MGTTVESIASGFGITERARRSIANWQSTVAFARAQFRESSPYRTAVDPEFHRRFDPGSDRFAKLLALAEGDVSKITTRLIAQAAAEGDHLSLALLSDATFCIGWALAQAVTLLNPGRIVVGGGVALIGEELFFKPVRRACASQVFGPFAGLAEIVPAELGEEVVVHGALAVAAAAFLDPGKG